MAGRFGPVERKSLPFQDKLSGHHLLLLVAGEEWRVAVIIFLNSSARRLSSHGMRCWRESA